MQRSESCARQEDTGSACREGDATWTENYLPRRSRWGGMVLSSKITHSKVLHLVWFFRFILLCVFYLLGFLYHLFAFQVLLNDAESSPSCWSSDRLHKLVNICDWPPPIAGSWQSHCRCHGGWSLPHILLLKVTEHAHLTVPVVWKTFLCFFFCILVLGFFFSLFADMLSDLKCR